MTGPCCMRGRITRAAAAMLPGAAWILLPKCPLCLAAWLAAVTGVGFSAAGAGWVRSVLVVLWIGAVALAAASMVRRPRLH